MTPSLTYRYSYDDWNVVEIATSSTDYTNIVDAGMDDHIAIEVVTSVGSDMYYFLTDERGNVVALTDDDGTIVEQYRYRVYGEHEVINSCHTACGTTYQTCFDGCNEDAICEAACLVSKNTCDTTCTTTDYAGNIHDFLWGGSLYEPETGLYWMRNRYYHLDMHRFINQDPIGIWGDNNNLGNGFAYVAGMVIEAADPTGLYSWSQFKEDVKNFFRSIANFFKNFTTNIVDSFRKLASYFSLSFGSTSVPEPETEEDQKEKERVEEEKAKASEAIAEENEEAKAKAEEEGKPEETDSQKEKEKIEEAIQSGIAYGLITFLSPWNSKEDNGNMEKPKEEGWKFMITLTFNFYPSDPDSDEQKLEKLIFYRALLIKLTRQGEEMPDRVLVNDHTNDTGRYSVKFFDNPYKREKDPLVEMFNIDHDDAGRYYFNRFGKNGIHTGDESKNGYETVTEKGFNRGNIDPYFY